MQQFRLFDPCWTLSAWSTGRTCLFIRNGPPSQSSTSGEICFTLFQRTVFVPSVTTDFLLHHQVVLHHSTHYWFFHKISSTTSHSTFKFVVVRSIKLITFKSDHCVDFCRLCETSLAGKYSDVDGNLHTTRSIGLARSQEPLYPEDVTVSKHILTEAKHICIMYVDRNTVTMMNTVILKRQIWHYTNQLTNPT